MERRQHQKKYYYIDESGSPEFYAKGNRLLVGKPGYSPLLTLGMIATYQPKALRQEVESFSKSLKANPKFEHIHSLHKPNWFLHAKNDHPLVRKEFFQFIYQLPFHCYIVIGRKKLEIFHNKHDKSEAKFYFDLINHMMHPRFKKQCDYQIYLSHRSGNNQERFESSIQDAIAKYNSTTKKDDIKPNYSCDVVKSQYMPEMSIVDYMLWALNRYVTKGELNYYEHLIDKYAYIYDVFGQKGENKRHYHKENKFYLEKCGSLI